MASDIKIKRSGVTVVPTNLKVGELAYSFVPGTSGGDRLYIGTGAESSDGNAINIDTIGGKFFTERLDHTAGTLTASSAIVVDSNLKIDQLNIDNISVNGNSITSTDTNGDINISPNGNGVINVASSRIANVASPTVAGDVATKGYVDGITGGESISIRISTASDSSLISLTESDLSILGGTGLTSTLSSNVVTINLDNTAVTAGTYGDGATIPSFTVDSQGRITNVTTATVTANIDSALVRGLVDSSYVQARQTAQDFAYSSLTGVPDLFDSADAVTLIDSAYVQARQLNFDQLLDSAEVIQLVDSAYVQARQSTLSSTDNLSEGSTNLYYTKARSDSDIGDALASQGYNTVEFDSDFGSKTTDDLTEGSSNLYYTEGRFTTSFSGKSTTDLSEGNNLYYTAARVDSDARNAISALDNGGEGSFTYNSNTGAFTYTGPSSADIRNQFSAGTGVTISSGEISIGQAVDSAATPTFGNITTTGYLAGPANFTIDPAAVGDNTGKVIIAGDLQVDGTTTTINSTTLSINDKTIVLADSASNAAAADGAGITIDGANATLTYAATGDKWVFNKALDLGTNNLTTSGTLNSHTIPGGTGTLALTSDVPSNTDGLSEGSTNLYYTTARHDSDTLAQVTSAYVQARQDFAYSSLTGKPNILDSADVTALVTAGSADSATITAVVDSDYIRARRPAETILQVANSGSGAYAFSGDGFPTSENNPTLYLTKGMTYEINVNASGHPFWIKTGPSTGTGAAYNDGVTNNGTQTGTILFTVPFDAPKILYYICQYHLSMLGLIYIIDTESFVDSAEVESIIDSAYIQARQDFAYSSLTGAPNVLDSADIVKFTSNLDSSNVTTLIDSAYVQARQLNFDQLLDSSEVIQLIDSDYIHTRRPAEATFGVASGAGVYNFTRDGFPSSKSNPDLYLQRGLTYHFVVNASGHPFYINTTNTTGTGSAYNTGVTNNGTQSGTIKFTVPMDAPNTLHYNCQYHSSMNGPIYITNSSSFLDSAAVVNLVDSAYVAARQTAQDFAYSSLTGAPNVLDSANVTNIIDSAYVQARQLNFDQLLDSAEVIQLIDSAYVAARSAPTLTVRQVDSQDNPDVTVNNVSTINFDNVTGFNVSDQGSGSVKVALGSGYKTIQVSGQSDLVAVGEDTLEVVAGGGIDLTTNASANPKALTIAVDSAFVVGLVTANSTDSATITALVDSAYVQLRQTPQDFSYASITGKPDFFDSNDATILIDSAYVQARQTAQDFAYGSLTGTPNVLDSANVIGIVDSAYIQARQSDIFRDSAFVTGIVDAAYIQARDRIRDSNFVQDIVDSAYVQARQSSVSSGGIDSAAVTNLVDSAYVQARQSSVSSGGIDSAAVTNLIDSAYVEARVPAASSGALGGLSNVSTTGQAQGSIIIYNGSSWVIDQNAFIGIDGGVATFVDEDITDDCGSATTSYSTRDRVDCGTAFAA